MLGSGPDDGDVLEMGPDKPRRGWAIGRRGRLALAGACALLVVGRHPGRPPAELLGPADPALARLITEVTTVPVSAVGSGSGRPPGARTRASLPASELIGGTRRRARSCCFDRLSPRRPARERPPALLRRQARGPLRRHRILPLLRRPELAADRRAQPTSASSPASAPAAPRPSRASRRSTAGPSTARPTRAPTWPSPRSRPTPMSWSSPKADPDDPTSYRRLQRLTTAEQAVFHQFDSRGQTPFTDFGGTATADRLGHRPGHAGRPDLEPDRGRSPASGQHRRERPSSSRPPC